MMNTDPLTGLPDRSTLDKALKQAVEAEGAVALALVDVDYFAEVNNTLGYEAGDGLLQGLAGLVRRVAPETGYRIGGDEIAIMLPNVSLEQAFLRMETLRKDVEAARDEFGLPAARAVTITVGVAQYPRDGKDVRRLWSAADAALEAAKENGRNQVGLPPNEEMIMKSCYYPASSLRKLKTLAERQSRKESHLLREGLDDLFRKYDVMRDA